jgi:exopolysaccharide production protein ExoY
MSLVGPRPVTEVEMLVQYRHHGPLVTKVRPGLTGLWQVSGRNDIDYSTRVQLDVEYVLSRSIVGDVAILLRTLPAVFAQRGVS